MNVPYLKFIGVKWEIRLARRAIAKKVATNMCFSGNCFVFLSCITINQEQQYFRMGISVYSD